MTTKLFSPAAYARYQTSGASYTADAKGVIAASDPQWLHHTARL